MPITGQGWELYVKRLGLHVSNLGKRTYDTYQVYRNGQPVPHLAGNMCECVGPGNLVRRSGKRITQGRYPLSTHVGHDYRYRTIGYSTDLHSATPWKEPMPGILLGGTEPRGGILVHPGHFPKLFLSSIGCFNPTKSLGAADKMDFWESRARVVAMIDDLRTFAPAVFQQDNENTRIPDAWAVVDGEPMNVLSAEPAPSA
jgi:hypothetical protein